VEKTLIPRVPTLEHEGFFLSESSAIVEYLEETVPPPATRLLPSRRNERASARQIMGWLRSDLFALRAERPSSTIFFDPRTEPLSDAARADAGKLLRIATTLVRSPDATLFNTWSIVDAELAFVLMRLVVNSDPIPDPLRAYAAHQWGRPSVQSFVDQPRKKKH
jgi:glutathione S-transferase